MRDTTKKDDTRQRLIEAGAGIMHRKGYNGTGIQEVLDACGVPKGSFYHFFRSKEDFALQVVDHQAAFMAERLRQLFSDAAIAPLERVRKFFDLSIERTQDPANPFGTCGCPIGNLVQEMAHINPAFRQRLDGVMRRLERGLASVLREAQAAGDLGSGADPDELARFIAACGQGAMLRMKAEGSPAPLARARDFLMAMMTAR
ncbi:MAG: hypothetical protein A2051_12245 [Desulfovibrionales bacterium GWA2_65_9]|nr:MAG: hypothetical protein A2051_12245 [Desulfovibrionales bacterium GWA2_65_9]